MAQQICNQFEPTTNTSSATICKWCGQEKFLHAPKVGNMAQQTAVEWLVENLHLHNDVYFVTKDKRKTIEQAKEMEKKQRIKDYNAGYTDAQCNHVNDAENYVNEQEYLNNKL